MHSVKKLASLAAVLVLVAAACGGDDAASDGNGDDGGTDDAPVANACPSEGCEVRIVDVSSSGEELEVTFDANFLPDVSRNHIHIYWDTYTADQVSSDAESRGVAQGDWHPTDAFPSYITESAASVVNRGDSTTLCVTAADRDHAVIDSSVVHCMDVSSEL